MKLSCPFWLAPALIALGLGLFVWLDLLAPGPARQALATATCQQLENCRQGQFNYQQWPPWLEITMEHGAASAARIKRAYQAAVQQADAKVAFFAPDPAKITYRAH
jgi:hypothetical protein